MSQQQLRVQGLSSHKEIASFHQEDLASVDPSLSLMDFLRSHDIPVASSCYGEGVCRKCLVNTDIVSCQITLINFCKNYDTLVIDYL